MLSTQHHDELGGLLLSPPPLFFLDLIFSHLLDTLVLNDFVLLSVPTDKTA